ncbi:hypothetical protein KXD40_001754 [Peronospora effusa]|nr:hypothetical protein KXD40_001754 [Peronospora effusa]
MEAAGDAGWYKVVSETFVSGAHRFCLKVNFKLESERDSVQKDRPFRVYLVHSNCLLSRRSLNWLTCAVSILQVDTTHRFQWNLYRMNNKIHEIVSFQVRRFRRENSLTCSKSQQKQPTYGGDIDAYSFCQSYANNVMMTKTFCLPSHQKHEWISIKNRLETWLKKLDIREFNFASVMTIRLLHCATSRHQRFLWRNGARFSCGVCSDDDLCGGTLRSMLVLDLTIRANSCCVPSLKQQHSLRDLASLC